MEMQEDSWQEEHLEPWELAWLVEVETSVDAFAPGAPCVVCPCSSCSFCGPPNKSKSKKLLEVELQFTMHE